MTKPLPRLSFKSAGAVRRPRAVAILGENFEEIVSELEQDIAALLAAPQCPLGHEIDW